MNINNPRDKIGSGSRPTMQIKLTETQTVYAHHE